MALPKANILPKATSVNVRLARVGGQFPRNMHWSKTVNYSPLPFFYHPFCVFPMSNVIYQTDSSSGLLLEQKGAHRLTVYQVSTDAVYPVYPGLTELFKIRSKKIEPRWVSFDTVWKGTKVATNPCHCDAPYSTVCASLKVAHNGFSVFSSP